MVGLGLGLGLGLGEGEGRLVRGVFNALCCVLLN